ncbi:MAG: hypothetical protein ACYTG2_11750 [Planctomycetota bacterium]|jgi:hypothetical protein
MRINARALALACAVIWGGGILIVGLAATVLGVKHGNSYYGKDALLALASIYPGYTGTPGVGNSLIGALYGALDGLIGGAVLAWIYNACAGRKSTA